MTVVLVEEFMQISRRRMSKEAFKIKMRNRARKVRENSNIFLMLISDECVCSKRGELLAKLIK
jgi:hypothetical protein